MADIKRISIDSVSYNVRDDSKIDKSLFTYEQNGETASISISKDSFFIHDGDLARATVDILIDDALIEGENYEVYGPELGGGLNALNDDIASAKQAISNLNDDVDAAEQAITGLNSDMDAAEQAITSLNGDMDVAEQAITSLNSDMTTANQAISNLNSSAVSNITRSGTTFTATRVDGTTFTFTQQDNTRTDAEIVNLIYPVGSIYMSVNSTSPATLFGGTWSQLKDRFLLGVGDTYTTAEGTGGAASVSYTPAGTNTNGAVSNCTLTVDQIPSHNHSFTGSEVTSGGISANHTHTGTSGEQSKSHTHTTTTGNQSQGHTHTGPSHTHTGPSHTHTGPSHQHQSMIINNSPAVENSGSGSSSNGYKWGFSWDSAKILLTGAAGTGATGAAGTGATGAAGTGNTGGISANHTHTGTSGNQSQSHTHTTTTGNQSVGHTHKVTASGTIGNKGGGKAHGHGFTQPTFTGTAATIATMPPYLAVYMWKRTA